MSDYFLLLIISTEFVEYLFLGPDLFTTDFYQSLENVSAPLANAVFDPEEFVFWLMVYLCFGVMVLTFV
jgi:hypothetical protein